MKKRILSLLLAALLLLSLLPAASLPARAETPAAPHETLSPPLRDSDNVVSGTCGAEGDNLTWQFDRDTGALVISGVGEMMPGTYANYSSNLPWAIYDWKIKTVVIENGVTTLSAYAFKNCYGLVSVSFPESLTSIGEQAFYSCFNLHTLLLPEGLTSIGESAFDTCSELQTVILPEGLTSVGTQAFRSCNRLETLVIPASLTSPSANAFQYCIVSNIYFGGSGAAWSSLCASQSGFHNTYLHLNTTDWETHWNVEVFTAPTCTSDGSGWMSCSCDYSHDTIFPALGHDFEEGFCVHCGDPGVQGICGEEGDNLLWDLDFSTGVLTITGSGTMMPPEHFYATDWSTFQSGMPWEAYVDQTCALVLKAEELQIGDYAFFGNCFDYVVLPASCWIEQNTFFNTSIGQIYFDGSIEGWNSPIYYYIGEDDIEYPFSFASVLSGVSMIHLESTGPEGHWTAVNTAPTCVTDGVVGQTCPCGYIDAEITPALGHDFVDGVCTRCGWLEEEELWGFCGDEGENLTWRLDPGTGVLTISGSGAMAAPQDNHVFDWFNEDYDPATDPYWDPCYDAANRYSMPWSGYEDLIRAVIFEAGVSELSSFSFANFTELDWIAFASPNLYVNEKPFLNCCIQDLLLCFDNNVLDDMGWWPTDEYGLNLIVEHTHFSVNDPKTHWTEVSRAPSCTAVGYSALACTCGYLTQYQELPALGHDFVEGVCTRCGQTDYEADGAELPWGDVAPTAYYAAPVAWAVNNGVAAGTSEDSFSPDENCSRAQLMTFLWRAAGCPEPVFEDCPFTDVPADAYYTKAVLWAVEQGITSGTSDTSFSPKQVCTRAQTVSFLWRAEGSPAPASGDLPFTDLVSGAYYYKAVKWAAQQGIVSGVSETSFAPNQACTRGQAVTILYRYYHLE
jgi:S-layer homology domain.